MIKPQRPFGRALGPAEREWRPGRASDSIRSRAVRPELLTVPPETLRLLAGEDALSEPLHGAGSQDAGAQAAVPPCVDADVRQSTKHHVSGLMVKDAVQLRS